MKKNKDRLPELKAIAEKRQSEDVETGASKPKKKKKHQTENSTFSPSSPKKGQFVVSSTTSPLTKKQKTPPKESQKHTTDVNIPLAAAGTISNASQQGKKKKNKLNKFSKQKVMNGLPASADSPNKAGTTNLLTKEKRNKPSKVVKKFQNKNGGSSITMVDASVSNTEAKKKKKKKKKHNLASLADASDSSSPSKLLQAKKQKKLNQGALNGLSATDTSGSSSLKKLQKKKKVKHNQESLNGLSSPGASESSSPSIKVPQKKKKKSNQEVLNVSATTDTSESSPSSKQLKKKKKKHNKEGLNVSLTTDEKSSQISKKKKDLKSGKQNENTEKESTNPLKIQSLKGKARKRYIARTNKTISKLKDYINVQGRILLKTTSEEKKNKLKSQIRGIQKKIKKFESELAPYQDKQPKSPEVINKRVYRGLPEDPKPAKKKEKQVELKEFLQNQMKSSRFRWLNENLYTSSSDEAQTFFKEDPESFKAYHEGYSEQVAKWPVNPLDVIINELKSLPHDTVVADLGCGEAKLAAALPKLKVHSLDLIALKPEVIACDMAHCPLLQASVDVVVFCLSLMGTNVGDFLLEANRLLKIGGTMEIAEVESRFDSVDDFIKKVQDYGFTLTKKNPTDMFFFLAFKKKQNVNKTGKLPGFELKACTYKKR